LKLHPITHIFENPDKSRKDRYFKKFVEHAKILIGAFRPIKQMFRAASQIAHFGPDHPQIPRQDPTNTELESIFHFTSHPNGKVDLNFISPKLQPISATFARDAKIVEIFYFLEQNVEFHDVRIISQNQSVILDNSIEFLSTLIRSNDVEVWINHNTKYLVDFDDSSLDIARELGRSKKWEDALFFCRRSIARYPNNVYSLSIYAIAQYNLDKYRTAINHARKAIQILNEQNINDILIKMQLLKTKLKSLYYYFCRLEQEKKLKEKSFSILKEAIIDCENVLSIDPNDKVGLSFLYRCYHKYIVLEAPTPICMMCRKVNQETLHSCIPEDLSDIIGRGKVKQSDAFMCDVCLEQMANHDEYFVTNIWEPYKEGVSREGYPLNNGPMRFENTIGELYHFCIYTAWKCLLKREFEDENGPEMYSLWETMRTILIGQIDPIVIVYFWINDIGNQSTFSFEYKEGTGHESSWFQVCLGQFQIFIMVRGDGVPTFEPGLQVTYGRDFLVPSRKDRVRMEPYIEEVTEDEIEEGEEDDRVRKQQKFYNSSDRRFK
jgi:tetratricopeptide (TPR) repeat protein